MSNWAKGINFSVSTNGNQIASIATLFVSRSKGQDLSGWGSPTHPYKTIGFARSQSAGQRTFILDEDIYEEDNISFVSGDTIQANTKTTIKINNTFCSTNVPLVLKDINIIDGNLGASQITLEECYLQNCTFTGQLTATDFCNLKDCTFTITNTSSISRSNLFRCSFTGPSLVTITNTHIDSLTSFVVPPTVSYCNNTSLSTVIDGGQNINNNIPNIGDVGKMEFIISDNSPLIGKGTNQSTIGGYKRGQIVSFTNSIENNNIDLTNDITLSTGEIEGNIKTDWIVLENPQNSPTILTNGIPSPENNPDKGPYHKTPTFLTTEINYKEVTGGLVKTGVFVMGVPMYKDSTGKTTGDILFNWGDINLITSDNLIQVKEYQLNITFIYKATPLSYGSNLHAWFDADIWEDNNGNKINHDSRVKTLYDRSGNGKDLQQTNTSYQFFHSSVTGGHQINGQNSIHKPASSNGHIDDIGNWAGLSNNPFFILYVSLINSQPTGITWHITRNNLGETGSGPYQLYAGSSRRAEVIRPGIGSALIQNTDTNRHILLSTKFNPINLRRWTNGTEDVADEIYSAVISETFDTIRLGSTAQTPTNSAAEMEIYELAFIKGDPEDNPLIFKALHNYYYKHLFPSLNIQTPII